MSDFFITDVSKGIYDVNQFKKKRVKRACDGCRKSKVKCDGLRACQKCLSENKICTYTNTPKNTAKALCSRDYVVMLEKRSALLELSLNKLLSKIYEKETDFIDFEKLSELNSQATLDGNSENTESMQNNCQMSISEKIRGRGVNVNYLISCLLTEQEYSNIDNRLAGSPTDGTYFSSSALTTPIANGSSEADKKRSRSSLPESDDLSSAPNATSSDSVSKLSSSTIESNSVHLSGFKSYQKETSASTVPHFPVLSVRLDDDCNGNTKEVKRRKPAANIRSQSISHNLDKSTSQLNSPTTCPSQTSSDDSQDEVEFEYNILKDVTKASSTDDSLFNPTEWRVNDVTQRSTSKLFSSGITCGDLQGNQAIASAMSETGNGLEKSYINFELSNESSVIQTTSSDFVAGVVNRQNYGVGMPSNSIVVPLNTDDQPQKQQNSFFDTEKAAPTFAQNWTDLYNYDWSVHPVVLPGSSSPVQSSVPPHQLTTCSTSSTRTKAAEIETPHFSMAEDLEPPSDSIYSSAPLPDFESSHIDQIICTPGSASNYLYGIRIDEDLTIH